LQRDGFGQTGLIANAPATTTPIQGMGGLMSVTGERDELGGGPPKGRRRGWPTCFTGMYSTVGILAALAPCRAHRRGPAPGHGACSTPRSAMLANLGRQLAWSAARCPGRAGNAHQNIVPYQVFEVAPADDGTRTTSSWRWATTASYAKFCQVRGRPELAADPRFARNQDRVRNRADPGAGCWRK
jgi:crotonobetainyl-CoA:carnitine CoA-transferase CaiB-like acyl-CoA transferase